MASMEMQQAIDAIAAAPVEDKKDAIKAAVTATPEQGKDVAQAAYDAREAQFGSEVMRELERRVLLSVLDRKWREHLYEMDYLREGIYLRAYSQRDPLVEYQREGFDMFAAMMDGIKEESVGFLFNLQVEVDEDGGEGEEPEADEVAAAPQVPQVSAATPQIDFG